MKKVFFLTLFVVSGFIIQTTTAQISIKFRVNIGTQPAWGPVGYDHVEYYYMPDIDAFYYVPRQQYIYQDRGRWIFTTTVPARFRNFDFNNGYKVVINDPKPYRNAASYRLKYANYKGNHDQQIIRNSHESKYFENKGHPEYKNWKKNKGRRKN